MKDTIYQQPLERIAGFTFDESVVQVFPDMIQRSVPGYSTIIAMTGVLAARFAKPQSNIYDLGCSLGASSFAMAREIGKQQIADVSLIGVDNSAAMIERCQQLLASEAIQLKLQCANIQDIEFKQASVVVLNFSLQFIPVAERSALLARIRRGMLPGGILVLSEKICFADAELNSLNIALHHEFKKANGYSELEISQKRTALETVLIPETLATHHQRLQQAGFSRSDVWFQCFNFASIIALT